MKFLISQLYKQFKPHNNWMVKMSRLEKFKYNFREAKYIIWTCWYHFRCNTLTRLKWPGYNWNKVNLKGIKNYYRDYDIQILFFAFQIFEDFYTNPYNDLAREGEWWDTAQELYTWWQKRKLDWGDDYEEEDDAMLLKLMEIRKNLWI